QAIAQIAYEKKESATADAPVTPELREELYDRLREREVTIDRATWDGGASYVDRLLQREIVRRAAGDSAMFRLQAPEDVQLQRAAEYLRRGDTQSELFAVIPARDSE